MTIITLIVFLILVLLPSIPMALAWGTMFKQDASNIGRRPDVSAWLLLLITTFSFAWLLAGLLWAPIVGLHYTTQRYAVIYANLVVAVLDGILSSFVKHRIRRLLILSATAVAGEWMYLAFVSYIV